MLRRMRISAVAPVLVLAIAAAAAPAQAGQLQVHACDVNGVLYDNRTWELERPAPGGIDHDTACVARGGTIGLRVETGARTPDGAEAAYTFRAPAGTTIADFRLDRRLRFENPTPQGTHKYYALYVLGNQVFAGAGNYHDGTRDRLNQSRSWYGYPAQDHDTQRTTVTRATFPALAGYRGDATTLSLRVGCFQRGEPCGMGEGGRVAHNIFGSTITLEDSVPPADLVVEATGLLAGGQRSGTDPVRIARASDNTGIRRAEILDVTDPAAPVVVGAEDYDTATSGTRTDQGAGCSYRLAHPCPNLSGETLVPSTLPAGRRQVAVRVTDPGGLARQSQVYPVDVVTPSDRGVPNGAAAADAGGLTAAFAGGAERHTARFGKRATITGRLLNPSGQPVAGAEVRVITRDADRDAYVDRGAVTTDADGRFSYRAVAYANRLIQFGWKARANDPRYAANAYVTLRVRASATLRADKRRVALRRRVTLRGRLEGRRNKGVDVVLEGRGTGEKRYRTFDRVRTRSGGRFTVPVRFLRAASRGQTFRIRARIIPTGRYPYVSGLTETVRVRVR